MALVEKAPVEDRVGAGGEKCEVNAASIRVLAHTALRALADPATGIPARMLSVLCARLGVEQGSMALLAGESLRIAATWRHADIEAGQAIPRRGSIAWAVIEHGREMHLSGVFDSRRTNYETYRHSLVLPIRSNGCVRGTININRRRAAFTPEDLWLGLAGGAITERVLHLEQALAEERHPLLSGLNVALGLMSPADRQMTSATATTATQLARLVGAGAGAESIGISARLALAAAHAEIARILMAGSPVELSGAEQHIIPALSADLLRALGADPELCDLLEQASERWDGGGPRGLGGDELALAPQLLALARAAQWQQASDLTVAVARAAAEAPGKFSPQLITRIRAAAPGSTGT